MAVHQELHFPAPSSVCAHMTGCGQWNVGKWWVPSGWTTEDLLLVSSSSLLCLPERWCPMWPLNLGDENGKASISLCPWVLRDHLPSIPLPFKFYVNKKYTSIMLNQWDLEIYFFFFWLCRKAYRMLILWPGIEPMPPAMESQILPTTGLPRNSQDLLCL